MHGMRLEECEAGRTQNPIKNLDLAGNSMGCAPKAASFLGDEVRDLGSMSVIDSITMSAPSSE
jgi:hypothetical protein